MAEKLGISERSLQRLRAAQKVPWHPLMGSPHYYEDEVVEAFLNDQLNRGRRNDSKEDNKKIRRTVRGKGEGRGEGVLEKLLVNEGRLVVDQRDPL